MAYMATSVQWDEELIFGVTRRFDDANVERIHVKLGIDGSLLLTVKEAGALVDGLTAKLQEIDAAAALAAAREDL